MYMNTLYSIKKYRNCVITENVLNCCLWCGRFREGLGSWLSNTGSDAGQGNFFNQNRPLNSEAVIRDPKAFHGLSVR